MTTAAAPEVGVLRERVGAEPVRRVVGVALPHRDVGRGDAELVGDDLRVGGLVALALVPSCRA